MQYLWQHRLWTPSDMHTVDGDTVDVLDPGLLNENAGPDFFNAKIRIGDCEWAGNVEIHIRASDWNRHGHSKDRAYDSVMLHVVAVDDCRIARPDGTLVPQLVLMPNTEFSKYYDSITGAVSPLPCADELLSLPKVHVADWLTALAYERLYEKASRVSDIAASLGGDWRGAIYSVLARALGFGLNSQPFERLAREVPLRCLLHHQSCLTTIEGALFGQAGLLTGAQQGSPEEYYIQRLAEEHRFFSVKYGLVPSAFYGWKMSKTRPQTFPQRRIALLAKMVSDGFRIATQITHVKNIDDARRLFDVELSPFWQRHSSFASSENFFGASLGKSAKDILIINAIAPSLHAYGTTFGNSDYVETAIDLLQQAAPENNSITRRFEAAGIECPDAFTSQALVQLCRSYCEPRKCLYCRFGHRFLSRRAIRR